MTRHDKEIFIEPSDSDITTLEYLIESLKQGFTLSSPLEILLSGVISSLMRIAIRIGEGVKLTRDAFIISKRVPKIKGNQPREYELPYTQTADGKKYQPLVDERDELLAEDEGGKFVLISSNPIYDRKKIYQAPGIHIDAQAFFEDLANILEHWQHFPYKDPYLYVKRELFGEEKPKCSKQPPSGDRPKDSPLPEASSGASVAFFQRQRRRERSQPHNNSGK